MAEAIIGSAIIGAAGSISAGRAAESEGKYNRSVEQRNADAAEKRAAQAIRKGEYNVKQFNKDFDSLQSQTEMKFLKAGVAMEGTVLEVLENNYREAELEKANIRYNAKVDEADENELAVIARMRGDAAYARGKNAKRASYFNAGSTLLGGIGKAKA